LRLLRLRLTLASERIGVLLVAGALAEGGARDDQRGQQSQYDQGLWAAGHGGYW
jgi:hypothetical protein